MKPLKTVLAAGTGLLLIHAAEGQVFVLGGGLGKECYDNTRSSFKTFGAAERACTRALREETLTRNNRAATYVNRGIIRMRHGKYDSAVEDYKSAMEIMPELGEAYLNTGAALIYKGEYDAAIPQLDKSIELESSELHAAYYNRAIAKENTGDIRGAYDDFQHALNLKPGWNLAEDQLSRFTIEAAEG